MDNKTSAFTALVHAYSADVYRFAYWLCKQRGLAEDITQETFTRAWKSLDSLKDDKSAKAWLFTILRHEMSRYFSRNRPTLVSLEDMVTEPEGDSDCANLLEQMELQEAIFTLELKYREPLLLQVIGGYSSQEIADLLMIKPGLVLTRICRARQQLRQALVNAEIPDNVVYL